MGPADIRNGVLHLRCIRRMDDVGYKRRFPVSDLLGSEGDDWSGGGFGGHELIQVRLHDLGKPDSAHIPPPNFGRLAPGQLG